MLTYEHKDKRFLPTLDRSEPLVMDSTASKLMKRCFRKYFYRIVLGRVPSNQKNKIVLDFGKFYHKFRELLSTKDLSAALAAMDDYSPQLDVAGKYDYLTKLRLMETCAVAYKSVEAERAQGRIRVVATEQPFNIKLPDGSFIGGRADEVIEWNGKIWGRDFKTTSKIESFFKLEFEPSDQKMRYLYAESVLHLGQEAVDKGQYISGILFEAMYNAKTVKPNIYNYPATASKYQIQKWVEEQIYWNKLLEICRTTDTWPMSEVYDCVYCEYRKVCAMPGELGMIQMLKTDFKYSPWNFNKVDQDGD